MKTTLLLLDHEFELILANMPRPQCGPVGRYEFRALGATMLVRWIPGSNSGAEVIVFPLDKKRQLLAIGNFYHADKGAKTLTFRKVK